MRWRRLAFWFTFTTLALVVFALSWLWTADLGVFKPQLERFVTQETGREFRIHGELDIDLARQTTILAEDIRFGNPDWADQDDMVTIGRTELRINLWSLFSGPVIVELIDLDDTEILLLNPGGRTPNWELPVLSESSPEDGGDESGLEVLIDQIDIDSLQVRLESVERERPVNLVIERLDQVHRDDDFLDLELRGSLDGRSVEVDGELGTWAALLSGKNFEIDLDAVLDTFTLSAHGRVDDIADLKRPEIEFTAAGPDIDDLTRMLGLGERGEGDINLAGTLKPVADGPLTLSIKGNLGQTEIDAVGEVADLQSFDKLQVQATASGPDLGRVLRLAGIHQVREAPFMLKFDAEMEDGRLDVREAMMVFADARIEGVARFPRFPSIDDAVLSIEVEGPDIERFRYITGMPGAAKGPFSIAVTLDVREDGVELLELRASSSLGRLSASGKVGDPETLVGSEIRFQVQSDSLRASAAAYGLDGLPDHPIEISGGATYTRDGIRTLEPIVATISGSTASIEGLVPIEPGAVGAELAFTAKSASLSETVSMFAAVDGIPAQAFETSGKLRIESRGYRFSDVTGTLGSTALAASGLLVMSDNVAGSRFDIRASGPAFEELGSALPEVDLHPGPFELSGAVSFAADVIRFNEVQLERPAGRVNLELDLGLPIERRWLEFDLEARGGDVRSVLHHVRGLEAYQQPFSLEGKGRLRGSHWQFDEVSGTVGNANFAARGDLDLDGASARTAFMLDLSIPDLAALGTLNGRRFNHQALAISAHAAGSDGRISVDGMTVRIGQSDIRGSVAYTVGDVPEVAVDVRSDKLVLLPLLEDEQDYDPEPDFDDGRLIPDIAIPFDAMRSINASLVADIGELRRKNLYLRDIVAEAYLQNGALDVPTVRFKARSGEMLARATLSPAGGSGEASLQAVARDFAPGLLDINADLAMDSDLDIDLRSTGTDLRTLAGNANGVVYIDTRGGRLEIGKMIQAIYGNMLEEMLGTINPARKEDPYTDFECMIVPLTVADGKVTGAPSIFASTEKIRAVTQGSVNLKTEEIRIGVRTTPRKVVSISAAELFNPYVQVVGTLASPRLAVDEAGVLITGGTAVATGGLSLLARGLWDRLSKSGDACTQVSEQALETLEGRVPVMDIPDVERKE